ncbi:hypothetical protein M422DRAFT_49535 [Sphaerobolus stellatus SS14]|uniref:Uncharacterized protein n=1 Tax=Sphaerobolus stellatus (strain SS14) TaxID=990650 RepID=A0A0C9VNN4_SPHS4|nr:hypothetical protein M422DRAFT_49535 [Sphaerobolus stellatus SS14]
MVHARSKQFAPSGRGFPNDQLTVIAAVANNQPAVAVTGKATPTTAMDVDAGGVLDSKSSGGEPEERIVAEPPRNVLDSKSSDGEAEERNIAESPRMRKRKVIEVAKTDQDELLDTAERKKPRLARIIEEAPENTDGIIEVAPGDTGGASGKNTPISMSNNVGNSPPKGGVQNSEHTSRAPAGTGDVTTAFIITNAGL